MNGDYELFERRPDGVLNWRGVVHGLDAARERVRLLVVETENECFALAPDRRVVGRAGPAGRHGLAS